jgi:hypothetical protein
MEHHHSGHEAPKKVFFGAPIIMGLAFWVITFGFLSMCDGPKEACCGGEKECCSMEQSECMKEGDHHGTVMKEPSEVNSEAVVDSSAVNTSDSVKVNEAVKEEGTKEETKKEEEHKH